MPNPHMPMGRRQVEEQQEQNELAQLNHENMIRKQMETPVGRAFVWHVLCKLGYMQDIIDTNASVYHKTAKQTVSNYLVKEIKKVCPELFMQMEREGEV